MNTKKDLKVGVVIPVYNGQEYLRKTINSVLCQSYEKFELVIVDDGSTDDSASIYQSFADPRISWVKIENQGVSNARNIGFSKTSSEYLAFLDADDVWLPNNLEVKVDFLENHKQVGLVHSDGEIIDASGEDSHERIIGKEGNILQDILLWNGTNIHAPSSILVRRNVIDTIGSFENRLSTAADQEFYFRVANKYKIGRVPLVTWKYRIHTNNMHQNIAKMELDHLLAYRLAEKHNLFSSKRFRNRCFANLYMILGASWWGNGKSPIRGIKFIMKAIATYPPVIIDIVNKLWKKIF